MKTKSNFIVTLDERNCCFVPHLNAMIRLFSSTHNFRLYELSLRDVNDGSVVDLYFTKFSVLTDFVNRFTAPHCSDFWRKFLFKNPLYSYKCAVRLAKENSYKRKL